MITKTCCRCKITKSIDNFFKNKSEKDGLNDSCKTCCRELGKIYRQKYRNKTFERHKKYRLENKEKVRQAHVVYANKNKEKIKLQKQKYYLENKEHIDKRNKQYNELNKEKLKPYHKAYNTPYCNKRRKNDINFKLRCNLRTRIIMAVKNNQKCGHTMDILGCSIEQFKTYMEKQFQHGMVWSNHGFGKDKWNIDHIIPCASFDLSDPKQQRICFHYTNMQPLWHKDNMKKNDSLSLSPQVQNPDL